MWQNWRAAPKPSPQSSFLPERMSEEKPMPPAPPALSQQDADLFRDAFRSNHGGCRGTCQCGAEFYNPEGGWDWEEGELEKLEKSNAQALEWTVGFIDMEGKEFVADCSCWHPRAGQIVKWLRADGYGIARFLSLDKKRMEAEAKFAPTVEEPPAGPPQAGRVHITSNGTAWGSKIVDVESGAELSGINRVELVIDAGEKSSGFTRQAHVSATLHLLHSPTCDITAEVQAITGPLIQELRKVADQARTAAAEGLQFADSAASHDAAERLQKAVAALDEFEKKGGN